MTHDRGMRASERVVAVAALAAGLIPAAATSAAAAGGAGAGIRPAATAGGTLRAWGFNGNGQLGDASMTSRRFPAKVRLQPGVTITSVRGGCFHTLALTSAGQVLAWGANDSGELGDGTFSSSPTPVRVTFPPGTGRITAVRAGCVHSLALTAGGRVLAWGGGLEGQLGDGASGTDSDRNAPVPVLLPTGTRIKAISAGADDSLALTSAGQVLAWGDNHDGQLGDGTAAIIRNTPVQVRLRAGTRVAAVTAGGSHSLALTTAGGLLAWGSNDHGQLGNGTTRGSNVPIPVRLPGGTRVRGLFAGCQHTLALTASGKVLAWGADDAGQLGDGKAADRHRPVSAMLPAGARVTAISAGCQHSLALTAAGRILAWGFNGDGELGNGTRTGSHSPVRVRLAAGLVASGVGSGPSSRSSWAIVR